MLYKEELNGVHRTGYDQQSRHCGLLPKLLSVALARSAGVPAMFRAMIDLHIRQVNLQTQVHARSHPSSKCPCGTAQKSSDQRPVKFGFTLIGAMLSIMKNVGIRNSAGTDAAAATIAGMRKGERFG